VVKAILVLEMEGLDLEAHHRADALAIMHELKSFIDVGLGMAAG